VETASRVIFVRVFIVFFALAIFLPVSAQTPERPLILPLQGGPGPNTWLFGQPYGNTTGAFNRADEWYSAGQGIHFGIDLSAPCGTPVVAVADGEIAFIDDFGFGSRPHNLLIRHSDLGYVSLYGHLLNRAPVTQGQFVKQGDVVGYSGDPDETCDSRPHLHYELRSLNYQTTYNPIPVMDAPWDALATMGRFDTGLFQQDLLNARRWMTLDDQPNVTFGGGRLNAYTATWPLPGGQRPPSNPPVALDLPPLSEGTAVTLKRIGYDNCCWDYAWHPTQGDALYISDGLPNQMATVFQWSASQGQPVTDFGAAPRPVLSPDGSHEVRWGPNGVTIRRLSDSVEWQTPVPGSVNLPAISPDNTRLMWLQRSGESVPGSPDPAVTLFVSQITGENIQQGPLEPGTNVVWLDNDRLLMTRSQNALTTIEIGNVITGERVTLGSWFRLRGLSIAPGGERVMFYLTNQPDPALSGVYMLKTKQGALPEIMPWFGAWRWRDSHTVYYMPFEPDAPSERLVYYDVLDGTTFDLIDPEQQPFIAMNGDWRVSADGKWVAFHNAADRNLWLLGIGE
jgi:murein DD-endopeptidase MepM/ murein hydrolase activator NlpD